MTVSGRRTWDRRVWERPLGIPFADSLTIQSAPDRTVREIYQEHHSYRPELDRVTIKNHVAILDERIVGAVTYAMPRRSSSLLGIRPDATVEVARVCVCADIHNLASCMLAQSQDKFMSQWGVENGIELLISFVHKDWNGSMFSALRGKGWEPLRMARSKKSGNREYTGIEDVEKTLWICKTGVEYGTQETLF